MRNNNNIIQIITAARRRLLPRHHHRLLVHRILHRRDRSLEGVQVLLRPGDSLVGREVVVGLEGRGRRRRRGGHLVLVATLAHVEDVLKWFRSCVWKI